jgi:predicted exporter
MSRRRPDDDHDDRPRKRGGNGLLIGLLVGGGLIVLLAVGGCVGLLYLASKGAKEQEKVEAAQAKALPTREEFRAAWMGKTSDELTVAFGKPEYTTENGRVTTWVYGGLTGSKHLARDPVTGKPCDTVWIDVDREGRIVEVRF